MKIWRCGILLRRQKRVQVRLLCRRRLERHRNTLERERRIDLALVVLGTREGVNIAPKLDQPAVIHLRRNARPHNAALRGCQPRHKEQERARQESMQPAAIAPREYLNQGPRVRSAAAVAIHALLNMRIACVSWVHFSPRSKCDGCGSSWASSGNKLPAPDSVSLDAEFSSGFSSESRNFCVWITHDRVSPRKARCQRPCKLSYLST